MSHRDWRFRLEDIAEALDRTSVLQVLSMFMMNSRIHFIISLQLIWFLIIKGCLKSVLNIR